MKIRAFLFHPPFCNILANITAKYGITHNHGGTLSLASRGGSGAEFQFKPPTYAGVVLAPSPFISSIN